MSRTDAASGRGPEEWGVKTGSSQGRETMARPGKGWLYFGGASQNVGNHADSAARRDDRRDAFDVVRQFLEDVQEKRRSVREVHAIKDEVRTVVARMERVQKLFPEREEFALSDELKHLAGMLRPGRGLLGKAALF